MQAEIVSRKENPLLKRVEIEFRIVHHGEGSPTRDTAREEIAKLAKAPKDRVIIDNMRSQFGKPETVGYAKIYDSREDALEVEREHILARNEFIDVKESKKASKVSAPKSEEETKVEEAKKEPGGREKPEPEEKGD